MISRFVESEIVRFLIAGGLNTALTYVIYLLLLFFISYRIAYSGAFVIGIISGYSLNTWIVFKEPWQISKMIQFPLVYLVQYLFGIGLITMLVEYIGVNDKIAPLIIIILLLPVTFFMSRWIIRKK